MNQKMPEGWQLFEFNKIAKLCKTKYVPNSSEHLKCLELEHFQKETGQLNGYVDSAEQSSTKNVFKAGDILFGKLRPYLRKFNKPDFDGVCSTEIWVLDGLETCKNDYLYLLIQTDMFNYACNVSTGTHMPRADWNFVENIPFLLPPLFEQEKIAEILSCWDETIEKLSDLIEQKKLLKKGLMQKLLTGKTRLSGFTQPWKEVKLEEVIKENKVVIEKGKTLTYENIIEGNIPVIAGGKISPYYHNNFTHNIPCVTISASGAYAGYVWKHNSPIWASDCNVLYGINYSTDFLGYCLEHKQNQIYQLQTGGAQPHVYTSDIKIVTIPNIEISEQKAIADILQSCDLEIEKLKTKLDLLKLQKKGLMQQLLTGKIRVKINK